MKNRQLYRLAACLVGAATLLLQSCSGNRNCDRLCGSWSSVEGKPDVLIYKEGDAYKVTVFSRSGRTRKLKPETYLLVEEDGNLLHQHRLSHRVRLQRGGRHTDLLPERGLCKEGGEAMRRAVLLLGMGALLLAGEVRAQWVVTDPGNLAQSIINSRTTSCTLPQRPPIPHRTLRKQ